MHRPVAMQWVVVVLALVLAACAPAAEPGCPMGHSVFAFTVQPEGPNAADIVFALDSHVDAQGQIDRVIEQLRVLVAPQCISRTIPGGGTPVDCDPANPDHGQLYPPIGSLHVGFVSADLGVRGSGIAACESDRGGDGRLSQRPAPFALSPREALLGECDETPAFLSFCGDALQCDGAPESPRDSSTALAFVASARCAARAVSGAGCPYAQPLEALWRALVEHGATEPEGSAAPNAGFVRERSLLVLVAVANGEDHSLRDCAHDGGFSSAMGASCVDGRDALRPRAGELPADADRRFYEGSTTRESAAWDLDRYLSATQTPRWNRSFESLRPGHPERLMFIGVVGVPLSASNVNGVVDYDALLGPTATPEDFASRDHARAVSSVAANGGPFSMRNERDPRCAHVVPACRAESSAYDPARSCAHESRLALPSRRIVEIARRFEHAPRCNGFRCAGGAVLSICADQLERVFTRVVEKLAQRLIGYCVPWPIEEYARAEGLDRLPCVGRVVLPEGQRCDASRAQTPAPGEFQWRVDHWGVRREVCDVPQAPTRIVQGVSRRTVAEGEGWYFDRKFDEPPTSCSIDVAFTRRAALRDGESALIECAVPVPRATECGP